MEHIYDLGVSLIVLIQDKLSDCKDYISIVNKVASPDYTLLYLLPAVSIVDSFFAAQLTLVMAFGNWLNVVMKWFLLEDRPYWWVPSTNFYFFQEGRPVLRQTPQTCETGPGSPSGHSQSWALLLVLASMWWAHMLNDLRIRSEKWKILWYPFCLISLCSVLVSRMYIAAHFPHQVMLGALIGGILCPFLTLYISDPYIWQYDYYKGKAVSHVMRWHVTSVVIMLIISAAIYFTMLWGGYDPNGTLELARHVTSVVIMLVISAAIYFTMLWGGYDPNGTLELAQRYCQNPSYIHLSTTPFFALANSTGHLLGWALTVTPIVRRYRHYTKDRYLSIAIISNVLISYMLMQLHQYVRNNFTHGIILYVFIFLESAVRVPIYLRFVPSLAMFKFKTN